MGTDMMTADLPATMQEQSFDQKFESSNKALLISCQKGLPLRVVRSHKVYAHPPPHTSAKLWPSLAGSLFGAC